MTFILFLLLAQRQTRIATNQRLLVSQVQQPGETGTRISVQQLKARRPPSIISQSTDSDPAKQYPVKFEVVTSGDFVVYRLIYWDGTYLDFHMWGTWFGGQ
jgi:hypothetical protein